ncbi:glycine zipper domain-containing protein [Stieleria sp. TO1_6]|uniref:glycine zipper domain-containing protein n=1 Tax=Stieleria tagensis TaxID=2956795 RepID=UPI00209B4ADE|nr:glycine zipper domain-containing protein [Stieleria tagensis]MCO8120967.1 glycine zipper domain-containing protein [Stieleria tagensis]
MIVSTRSMTLLVFVSLAVATTSGAYGQAAQQRGTVMGGLAGAIAGGIIGDNNDKAGAGAAIGGVVGAVAGGILGNASDKEAEMQRQRAAYYRAQQQQYAQQQQTAALQSAVTLQDVITMTRSGLSDQVVLNQIRQRGYVGKLQVNDIISLHQQGVSENVITGIQSMADGQPVAIASPAPTVVKQYIERPPVVIREHVLPHYPPPYYRSHHHHHRHAGRSSLYFGF